MSRSSESSDDRALEAALDDFLDWTEEKHVEVPRGGLPDAERIAGVGPGTTLGDYELVRRIDAGGMGVVFEARERSSGGRRVALKVLRNLFDSARLVERFRREVDTIQVLEHESIVPVLGAGVEGGTPYYAMKFIEGLAASRLVRTLRVDGEVPERASDVRDVLGRVLAAEPSGIAWTTSYVNWVAARGREIGDALQYAVEHGVTHRDVKPGNVMIGLDGRAVLLDFGLARRADEESMTGSRDFVGTLAYAAPEQVRGERIDARTDVYGLGATLYELLALRRAFDVEGEGELRRRIEHRPPPALGSWIPADLRTIVGCALEKKPARRYQTPGQMADDLREFLAGHSIHARPPGPLRRGVRRARRYPSFTGALIVVLVLVGALFLRDRQRAQGEVHAGRELLVGVASARAEWTGLREQLRDHLDAPVSSWGTSATRTDALAQQVRAARALVDSCLRDAESSLLDAFVHVAAYEPARAALAELYATELAIALEESADLLDRARIDRLHASIERFGGLADKRALLDRHGSVRLESDPPGAKLQVWPVDAPGTVVPSSGVTPLELDGLYEGAYIAQLELPGYAPARYPFVVRRAAVDALTAAAGPPRVLPIELFPESEILSGFIPIAGGWTLVRDDPPRWEYVPSFQMRRDELRYDEYLAWLTVQHPGPRTSNAYLPRYSDLPGDEQVRWCPSEAAYLPKGETQLNWPVRGLKPSEMQDFCAHYDVVEPFPSGHWYGSLPTRAEWLRAARGADARLYPWGDEFDWSRCRGHLSDPNPDREPWPSPVGLHPDDESPFLVRDMAGSVSEAVQDRFGVLRDEAIASGGSYRGQKPLEMSTTTQRRLQNRPETDVGVRAVLRRLPALLQPLDGAPADFVDEFERPASSTVGNGWYEAAGPLPDSLGLSARLERCSLARGRMVLLAEAGNNSLPSQAWHRVFLSEDGWSVRIGLTASFDDPDESRTLSIDLVREFLHLGETRKVTLSSGGRLTLHCGSAASAERVTDLTNGTAGVVELRARAGALEARAWAGAAAPPDLPWLRLENGRSGPPRFLGIAAASFVGSRVEVERVEVRVP